MTKPKTEQQEQRNRARKGGQYAKMDPCPRCGKRRAVGPAYRKDEGGDVRNDSAWAGLFICDPCLKEEGKE